jgi:hypothetical protein
MGTATRAFRSSLEASPAAGYSRSEVFRLLYSRGKVVPDALRPELADAESRTDGPNRRHAIRCQLVGEYLGCLFPEQVGDFRFAGHAIRYRPRTAYDHHE